MISSFNSNFDDVSERGFAKLKRRIAGLPPELPEKFWEQFLTDLQEDPDKRAALRALLAEKVGDGDE